MSEPIGPAPPAHRYGLRTASLLVVASMVGTGVFTTSGLLLRELDGSILGVLLVWVVGGLAALAGALSYAELAAHHPASGGEYTILGRSLHPALGFTAGFVSIVAGFAAPIAACAIAFARYAAAVFPGAPQLPLALGVIAVASLVHARRAHVGARFQDAATILKLVLIAAFLVGGVARADPSRLAEPLAISTLVSPPFAIGLVLVYFAYTGWNAAAYVAGEVDRPARTLPLAVLLGTLAVTALYVALNAVFLAAAPVAELAGVIEVGHVAATHLFGEAAGRALSAIIAIGLVSTIGALVVTGARVYEAMGSDHARLAFLGTKNADGAPIAALAIQAALAALMALTASFDLLLAAVGFTLSLGSALAVACVFVERRRHRGRPLAYRVPLYPLTPLFFVIVMGWTVILSIVAEPLLALIGVATIGLGLMGYAVLRTKT
jgi:APA family basic amino acid/polyamine antiporter